MKRILGWIVVVSLTALIGCGGGGGGGNTTGGGTTGGTTGGTYTGLAISGFEATHVMLDPRNLIPGDVVQLDMTGYDSKGNLKTLPVSGWATNAPAGVATLDSNGLLRAVAASANSYTIQVNFGGATYSTGLTVTAAKDLITGMVRNVSNPINNVGVDFFDSTGTQVGTGFTSQDGTFRASVAPSAVRFTIDMSLADPTNFYYYNEFAYNSGIYLELNSCLAKLPTPLSASSPTALPSPIVPQERAGSLPPPPPTGCVG